MSRVVVDFLYKPLQTLFSSLEFKRAVKKYATGGASITTYPTLVDFPETGDETTIYLAVDTNKIYYWDGSAYVEMSPGVGVSEFNNRTGAITLLSSDVTAALGYTPYSSANPSNYISGITSTMVTTALGYTPTTQARTLTINGISYDLSDNRSWTVSSLPSQTGNAGRYLTTDGTTPSWVVLSTSNIYTGDGSLTSNRTITMGAFSLSFEKDISVNGLKIGKGFGQFSSSTVLGVLALEADTNSISGNTAIGNQTLRYTTSGYANTALGNRALVNNTTGSFNTAIGANANTNNSTGSNTITIGSSAQGGGNHNVVIGNNANAGNTGSFNTLIGSNAGGGYDGVNRNTIIGYNNTSINGSNNTFLGILPLFGSTAISNNIILADGSNNMRLVIDSSGNTVLGGSNTYPTFAGYKLDVLGTGRFSGKLSVGTPSAASAVMEVTSTTQGFLPPRMTTAQREAISTPAAGLIVYDASLNAVYYYSGTAWTAMSGGSGGSSAATNLFNYYNFI